MADPPIMEAIPLSHPTHSLRPAVRVGLIAFAGALAIQLLAVFAVHDGSWTGPFLVAENRLAVGEWPLEVTPSPAATGYDGQYYLQLALDPARRGVAREPPLPRIRVRRILLPALAWATGFGQPRAVLVAYYLWCALFVGLGAGALADTAAGGRRSPWWGLLFLLQLGTVVSLWRMLIDGASAALMLATLAAMARGRERLAVALLAACLLSRETALVFFAGVFAAYWLQGRRRAAFETLAALVPAGLWWAWVHGSVAPSAVSHTAANVGWSFAVWSYTVKQALAPWTGRLASVKELSALALVLGGLAFGLVWGAFALWRRRRLSVSVLAASLALLLFSALGFVLGRAVWAQVWAYARVLLPVTALAAFIGLGAGGCRRHRRFALALAVAASAVGLVFLFYLIRASVP